MAELLVGTQSGCRVFRDGAEQAPELPGRSVGPFAAEIGGSCLAVVEEREIWRRSAEGRWTRLGAADTPVQSLLPVDGSVLLGLLNEAALLNMDAQGGITRVRGFDEVQGRGEWFAGGPPLGVRSLAALNGGAVLLAAVHVGGMPRSRDGAQSWTPTIPVPWDVHEVRPHPRIEGFAAAAAAVGLCISRDGGEHWEIVAEGLAAANSLALAVLEQEVLFSTQDGPFAARSQVWRWPMRGAPELVRRGLPDWLEGKVDTAQMTAGSGQAAICDGGGNLWLSAEQASEWRRIAQGLGYALGLAIL